VSGQARSIRVDGLPGGGRGYLPPQQLSSYDLIILSSTATIIGDIHGDFVTQDDLGDIDEIIIEGQVRGAIYAGGFEDTVVLKKWGKRRQRPFTCY
jgi:hypothetical protein